MMIKYLNCVLVALSCLLFSCNSSPEKPVIQEDLVGEGAGTIPLPDNLLQGQYPPYDLAKNQDVLANAIFAWREMIALSWKAVYSSDAPRRGVPAESWSYKDGTPDGPLVWETYAHRVEYRPIGDSLTKPFDVPPSYPFTEESEIDWNGIDPSKQFVVLDEDNEIGSCYIFAKPNIDSITTSDNLVMYMAKVNRAEYDYRMKYFNSHEAFIEAQNKIKPNNGSPNVELLKQISNYQDQTGSDPCGSAHFGEQGILVLPCSDSTSATQKQRGAMEIKTAWRPLTSTDNPAEFLVREAVVFDELEGSPKFRASLKKYALIGMHIIHKTNNFRHFFIATWEHNSVQNYGYDFVTIPASPAPGEDYRIVPVERHEDTDGAHSYIKAAYEGISTAVQAKIKAANPNNFLANYRLVGFQSNVFPTATLADRKTKMPAYYLANLIIESDSVLADFTGGSIGMPFNDSSNVVAEGQLITTGGCSGCHGVAQLKGADFSFLNDLVAKPIPSPEPYTLDQATINKIWLDSMKK